MKKQLLVVFAIWGLVNVAEAIVDITQDTTITGGRYDFIRVDYELPLNDSKIDIKGGEIDIYQAFGTCYTLVNGTATLGNINSYDLSIIDIYSGTVNTVGGQGGVVNLYYLTPYSDFVYASVSGSGTLNIYGYGFKWSYSGSSADYTGYWLNGESITFHFRNYEDSALENINVIPEPCTFLIMSSGLMLAMRRKL